MTVIFSLYLFVYSSGASPEKQAICHHLCDHHPPPAVLLSLTWERRPPDEAEDSESPQAPPTRGQRLLPAERNVKPYTQQPCLTCLGGGLRLSETVKAVAASGPCLG